MWIHLFRLFICLLLWKLIDSYEYCQGGRNVTLCGNSRHIFCNPEQMKEKREKGLNPKYFGTVPTTSKVIRVLRDQHNKYRNKIACGEIRDSANITLPKATRMRELIWDDELAFLAKEHAKQCVFAHDECRNTFRFRLSGQNIAWWGTSDFSKIIPLLEAGPRIWFEEYKNIKNGKEAADKYPPKADGQFGHFTLMAQDYVSRLGCALSVWEEQGKSPWQYLLTCNYDMTNVQNRAVYKHDISNSATECDFWENEKSDKYPCLCKNNGNMKYISSLGSHRPSGGGGKPAQSGGGGKPAQSGGKGGEKGEGDGVDAPVEADTPPIIDTSSWCTVKWLDHVCGYFPYQGKKVHVFCNGTNSIKGGSSKGKFGRFLEMTKDLRSHILRRHNILRNKLACGNVLGYKGIKFPAANRQRVVMWDWELAFTAGLHAKLAIFAHSACQGTYKYYTCGQNVAESRNPVKDGDYKKLISAWMNAFFESESVKVRTPVECAANYNKCERAASSHFTQIANEYVSRIGCAFSINTLDKFDPWYLFTCHYDMANFSGLKVYKAGTPGTNCSWWGAGSELSDNYKCLCKNNGKYLQGPEL